MCVIMGFLNGCTKLRRIYRWSCRHVNELRRYMPFESGIPSVPTMSRILGAVDEELTARAIMNWMGGICNTRNTHLAIDGKGLRAAARNIRDERTPYVLNVIDVSSRLLVGQLAIPEKTNEMAALPKLIGTINMTGSVVTIDAIGTTAEVIYMPGNIVFFVDADVKKKY